MAVRAIGAGAVTVGPVVFIDPRIQGTSRRRIVMHEGVHVRQQMRWATALAVLSGAAFAAMSWGAPVQQMAAAGAWGALEGAFLGLFLWRAVYLLALPVGWNPWRWKWEAEAYRKTGVSEKRIRGILRGPLYKLWWMGRDE